MNLVRFMLIHYYFLATENSQHVLRSHAWTEISGDIRSRWLTGVYKLCASRCSKVFGWAIYVFVIMSVLVLFEIVPVPGSHFVYSLVITVTGGLILISRQVYIHSRMLPMMQTLMNGYEEHGRDVLCLQCGYDLHGMRMVSCPECGSNVPR